MSVRQPVLLSEYRPPAWRVADVALEFDLDFAATTVRARLALQRHPERNDGEPIRLDGEGLELLAVRLDGRALDAAGYARDERSLTIPVAGDSAVVETEVRIRPDANTALEGLYRSGAFLLTQCEAEGFRRITYFPDRPDVMARFRVTLRADRARFPVLLANGNPAGAGALPDGRHFAVWDDPHPKPCYLFALVAGELAVVRDTFTTADGRAVRLAIYAEADAIARCDHAMACLRESMAWDEAVYGRTYDLDEFNIVATHDFNMGAMENKGLNIFNARYIVADLDTATDDDFEHVAGVVAHEYFHNWTGNRVTCRDWFQLSLKEGLTVFRDQQFSADRSSRAVKRIEDVRQLRSLQFAEDAGPFAHPVRPDRYVEINNFYTATVYEKGAEVIRMMHTVLGRERFRRGMDLYFRRHDGQAVTCEDYRAALADGGGVDLEPFARWYAQAGTPQLRATLSHDIAARRCTLTLRQLTPPTPGQPDKLPVPIPVRVMLYARDGTPLRLRLAGEAAAGSVDPASSGGDTDAGERVAADMQRVLLFTDAESHYVFEDIAQPPVASLLQDFSAPVTLHFAREPGELAFLARHDRDPFNRWQAMQSLIEDAAREIAASGADAASTIDDLIAAAGNLLADDTLDPAFIAACLSLPDQNYLADRLGLSDPVVIDRAHLGLRATLGTRLGDGLRRRYDTFATDDGTARDGSAIARRSLKNVALSLLMAGDAAAHEARARRQLDGARNMSDRLAALTALVHRNAADAGALLAQFATRYANDPLVLDKWLAVQASDPRDGTLERVIALTSHPVFNWRNPNKVRALIGTFARANRRWFHVEGGAGHRFVCDAVIRLDAMNPQIAARLVAVFNSWRRFDPYYRDSMRVQLERLAATPGLSNDVGEIVQRALA